MSLLTAIFKPGMRRPQNISCADHQYVCVCVWMCVCPPPRLLNTIGVIWTPYDWLNKFYSCYMAIAVVVINEHGLGIDTRHRH